MTITDLRVKIRRAKTNQRKNDLFMSANRDDRFTLLQQMILSMPKGTYLVSREGRAAPSLQRAVIEKYGVYAGLEVDKKVIRALAIKYPKRVIASFTLGLDQVIIK